MNTGLVLVCLIIIVGSSLGGSLVNDEVGSVVVRGKLNSIAELGSTESKVVGAIPDVVGGRSNLVGSDVNSSDEGGDGEEVDCGEGLTWLSSSESGSTGWVLR